jgi:hypothetical protein
VSPPPWRPSSLWPRNNDLTSGSSTVSGELT